MTEICRTTSGAVWVGNLPLSLREEGRQRVFENRALRRIFGPKTEEVPGG
jgi:hypothetical protein